MDIVQGKIEAIGQYSLHGRAGVNYTLVQFERPDGLVTARKNVAANNELATYMSVGRSGAFAFHRWKDVNILCGYAGGGRLVVADVETELARPVNTMRLIGWLFVGFGIPLMLFAIGVPMVAWGVFTLVTRTKLTPPPMSAVEAALRKATMPQ